MDNLTHTLIGLVAGETAARTVPPDPHGLPESTRRSALLITGMIGGNLPDVDLAWTLSTFGAGRLDYLLDHRGHTHTLPGCIALAALLWAAVTLWLKWRGHAVSGRDRRLLGSFALLSVLLHLGMDSLNSYGVHPFWPWDNRWYYGDAVFIVEPLFWVAAAPLICALRTLAARLLLALVIAAGCGAVLVVNGFALGWMALPASAVLLGLAGWRLQPRAAAWSSAALMVMVCGAFGGSGAVATQRVRDIAGSQFPGFRTLDQVLTPAPAQPLCWDVLLVQQSGDLYVVRHGLMVLGGLGHSSCPRVFAGEGTASLSPVAAEDAGGMHWLGEFSMSRDALRSLVQGSCRARALMHFVRAPFALRQGSGWILGDLRFDREAGAGFTEIELPDAGPSDCSYRVPWVPPRVELLAPAE